MKKGILLINILMMLCIIALGYKFQADWGAWEQNHNTESLMEKIDTTVPQIETPDVDIPKSQATQSEVAIIGEQNLFHKDRNMILPEEKKGKEKAKAQSVLKNRPVIAGIIHLGDKRSAHVHPSKKSGEGRQGMLLSEGDTWKDVDDWVVEEIQLDRMILVAGESREEILYHDPNKKRQSKRASTRRPSSSASSSILNIGGSSSGKGSQPRRSASTRPTSSRTRPTSRPSSKSSSSGRSRKEGMESGRALFTSRKGGKGGSASTLGRGTSNRTSPFTRSSSQSSRGSTRRKQ